MAVAHSGEANQTVTFQSVSGFTIANQTSTGSDRMGICHIGGYLGASGSTAVSWGGVSMVATLIQSGGDAAMFHLVAPATAASSVICTGLSGAQGSAAASTYTGADQSAGSASISNTAEATATSASPITVTCTTASGEMVVDAAGLDLNGTPAAGADQTGVLGAISVGGADGLGSYQLGAAGGVMSWTFSGSRYWATVAASIKAVAAAGVSVTPGTLALTTATFAPTVTATANQTVTPSTAALTISAFAPTVTATAHQTVTPDTAALTLTTFAPTVTGGGAVTVTPGMASLTLTTFAPSVTASETSVIQEQPRGGGGVWINAGKKKRRKSASTFDEDMARYARLLKDDQEFVTLLPMIGAAVERMEDGL